MIELFQEHYLSISPLGICRVLKCIKILFKGMYCFFLPVNDFPYMPICSTADFLNGFITKKNLLFNLLTHFSLYFY